MTVALFLVFCLAALWWVVRAATSDIYLSSPPSLLIAWQLAALSLLRGPEEFASGSTAVRVGLVVVSLTLVINHVRQDLSQFQVIPWTVFYSIVLTVAMVASSSPIDSFDRTTRVILLTFIFSQVAVLLDRPVIRRLLGEFIGGCAFAILAGALFVRSDAFRPIKAPVIQTVLEAPVLGVGGQIAGMTGLCLAAYAIHNRSVGLLAGIAASAGILVVGLQPARSIWLVGSVAFLVWLILHNRRQFLLSLVVLGLVVSVGLGVDQVRRLWEREQARPVAANIMTIRDGIFDASMERFRERPLIGDGLGVGNENLLIDVGQKGYLWTSHDEVSATLAATGLAGLLAVAWAHLAGVLGSRRAWRERADPYPIMVAVATLASVPFWHLIQDPAFISLPYLVFVLPECARRYIRLSRSEA